MAQIVFSYAREDVAVAQALAQSLERRGYTVFLDVDGRVRGLWRTYIAREIRSATDLVVLVSSHSLGSPQVLAEVQLGLDARKNFVPVVLGPVPDTAQQALDQLLAYQAARYDPLDLPTSTRRIAALLASRPSWRRHLDWRLGALLSMATALAFALKPWDTAGTAQAPAPAEPAASTNQPEVSPPSVPPNDSGHTLLKDGHKDAANSGFRFATQARVSWDSKSADILVARPDGQALSAFFLPYDTEPYQDPSQDSHAHAGIQPMQATTLTQVAACPIEGYARHWFEPRAGGVYCVRWRNGARFTVIKVDVIAANQISFDYKTLP